MVKSIGKFMTFGMRALVVLVPLYFFSLVPYAVCAGDVCYVEPGTEN